MFEFLTKRRDQDPLANVKNLEGWLKENANTDAHTANESIVALLGSFSPTEAPMNRDRLLSLMRLDDAGQRHHQTLCDQYLLNPRMSKSVEVRLWSAIVGYCHQVVRCYHGVLPFARQMAAVPGQDRLLPHLIGRALHNLAVAAKMQYFRFEALESSTWQVAHELYLQAEKESIHRLPLTLYAEVHAGSTTCMAEYIELLLLSSLNTGNFSPKQIDTADRLLDLWAKSLSLETTFQPNQQLYFVDLQQGLGARRMRQQPEPTPALRYLSTNPMSEAMRRVIDELPKGRSPAELGLPDDCRGSSCLELIKTLYGQWSIEGAGIFQRGSERRPVMKMMEVVHALDEICSVIRHQQEDFEKRKKSADVEYSELVDLKLYGFVSDRTKLKIQQQTTVVPVLSVDTESWVVENESEGGFGATVNALENDWVHLGVLIGMKPEDSENWVVGIVRRLNKLPDERFYAGIQVISQSPTVVVLRPTQYRGSGSDFDNVRAVFPFSAVYVPYDSQGRSINSLIMSGAEYAAEREFTLNSREKSFTVALQNVLEKGKDWLWVTFDVLAKHEAIY